MHSFMKLTYCDAFQDHVRVLEAVFCQKSIDQCFHVENFISIIRQGAIGL